jgi:hypothetical protein
MPEHPVRGHSGRMSAGCDDELAITQCVQRGLHGALGQVNSFSGPKMTWIVAPLSGQVSRLTPGVRSGRKEIGGNG